MSALTAKQMENQQAWAKLIRSALPFADAASDELPLKRLLRLSLFQVSVGMAMALSVGTLNRVMLVEFGVAATLIACMVALPVLVAPFRALIGFKSDHHRSALGWRRVPYIWYGTLFQFGGLAIMPFALLVLSGDNDAPVLIGQIATAFAFLAIGAGLQTTQTAGLALATDLAPEQDRPRVVALMFVMLLIGMLISSIIFALLLIDFTPAKLIGVIQGAAMVTAALNLIAVWKQEPRRPRDQQPVDSGTFGTAWRQFADKPGARRFLVAMAMGTAGFAMQDILLEPYGGEILNMAVSQTTLLTALFVGGSLVAFALAARWLKRGSDPFRIAAYGLISGIPGFSAVVVAAPTGSMSLFCAGTAIIGLGAGMFAVATLAAAISFAGREHIGLALGAWGAAQATAAGLAMAIGGILRDVFSSLGAAGYLGPAMNNAAAGYIMVYHVELLLLFATVAVIGPLARHHANQPVSDVAADSRTEPGLT